MVRNSYKLLYVNPPIKNMLDQKHKEHGVSHGLSEAGYDIRIAEEVSFWPYNMKRFVLAHAMEEFDMPDDLVGIVHDKSTWARKGLSVFNTVIEPGWKGFLTLELVYHGEGPLTIPAGAGIAQVIFHELSEKSSYDGKYQNQENKPVESKFTNS